MYRDVLLILFTEIFLLKSLCGYAHYVFTFMDKYYRNRLFYISFYQIIMKKSILYFFLFLFSGFWHETFSQCTLTVTPTNISCHGGTNGSASANASGGTAPYTYVWSTGVSNVSVSNLSAGTYSVTVINSSCSISGVELVNNGNFSGGNSGFSSSYIYNPFSLSGEGMYNVATNPSLYNGGFCSCGDHTSGNGNMMIV